MSGKKTLTIKNQKIHLLKNPFDFKNDPEYLRAKERALEVLKEAPLPDAVLKRLVNPK
jgi:hypothetical protein